jgi:hypothetical protein
MRQNQAARLRLLRNKANNPSAVMEKVISEFVLFNTLNLYFQTPLCGRASVTNTAAHKKNNPNPPK